MCGRAHVGDGNVVGVPPGADVVAGAVVTGVGGAVRGDELLHATAASATTTPMPAARERFITRAA